MAENNRYYEEELNYLIEAGREYASAHPERARFLNLSDPRHRDPHVERLVEAFERYCAELISESNIPGMAPINTPQRRKRR